MSHLASGCVTAGLRLYSIPSVQGHWAPDCICTRFSEQICPRLMLCQLEIEEAETFDDESRRRVCCMCIDVDSRNLRTALRSSFHASKERPCEQIYTHSVTRVQPSAHGLVLRARHGREEPFFATAEQAHLSAAEPLHQALENRVERTFRQRAATCYCVKARIYNSALQHTVATSAQILHFVHSHGLAARRDRQGQWGSQRIEELSCSSSVTMVTKARSEGPVKAFAGTAHKLLLRPNCDLRPISRLHALLSRGHETRSKTDCARQNQRQKKGFFCIRRLHCMLDAFEMWLFLSHLRVSPADQEAQGAQCPWCP